jgi:hypothetical protein
MAIQKMDDSFQSELQGKIIRTLGALAVTILMLLLADAGDEESVWQRTHDPAEFLHESGAYRGILEERERTEGFADLSAVEVDALVVPILELEFPKSRNDLVGVGFSFHYDERQDKKWEIGVDLEERMISTLIEKADEAR